MIAIWSARYRIDIGPHVFPTAKYGLVHDRLLARGILSAADIVEPSAATWDELALVHTRQYLDRLQQGTLDEQEVTLLELPWSTGMVEGFRLMAGGTIDAACLACGVRRPAPAPPTLPAPRALVCHIGGGLHHAFPNHGEGFCPFNDVAVAIRILQQHGIERCAVVDCDVHHGNGTAFIFESDPRVFTFSIHQQHNYPMWKPRGSLDIGLENGTGDEGFLAKLAGALPRVMASEPACVFYLAGADPFAEDQLGGLALTKEGLRARDRMVIETVVAARVPLVIVTAGGYARNLDDTVAIHVATLEEAIRAAEAPKGG